MLQAALDSLLPGLSLNLSPVEFEALSLEPWAPLIALIPLNISAYKGTEEIQPPRQNDSLQCCEDFNLWSIHLWVGLLDVRKRPEQSLIPHTQTAQRRIFVSRERGW